jgi:16S rRNA G966 N2-methylase RsmD
MSNWALRREDASRVDWPEIPDTPIDFSVLYKTREKGSSRHFGFFPFFAKKPWPVVQEYIRHYTNHGDLVCDPFAGSGVTAVEALVLGRKTIAGDVNPVARFITQMTAVAPIDLIRLNEAFNQVSSVAKDTIVSLDEMTDSEVQDLLADLDYPRDSIPVTVRGAAGIETVDKLHTPRQLAGLTILRDAINQVEDPIYRDLMKVVLANTARYANIMYILPFDKDKRRSPYRGDASFLRRFSYAPASERLFYENHVWPTVEHVFPAVYRAKEETNQLIGSWYSPTNFRLTDLPASRIHEITGEEKVDYFFADPPYSNRIFFLDLSTFWAAWLGMKITPEAKKYELIVGGTEKKSRKEFEDEFAKSIESIARALKQDHWFTLVYKHKDLSLWQTIVAACEDSGLHYVNAVWQNLTIKSTRQKENPNINPQGDMYLNFRKMSLARFESVYGQSPVLDLPTRANYVEHEIERIIVAYLGADIELITSSVIQQVLDSRAFHNYRENPEGVTEDIQKILKGPRFVPWQSDDKAVQWLMAPSVVLDSSLDELDRMRYYVFDLLRRQDLVTEGNVRQYLLTRLSEEHDLEPILSDVPALLRRVGREVEPHVWQFESKKVLDYKQLRLLFRPSRADEIRDWIEHNQVKHGRKPLRINPEGFALLADLLSQANDGNPQFETQYIRLQDVLQTIFERLGMSFDEQIERVIGIGDWTRFGIDLRNLPYEDVVIEIVLSSPERPFRLYQQIAQEVFSDLHDEDIRVQFRLITLQEWQHAESLAKVNGQEDMLGITLLSRA